jgi:hypothetical protein
LNGAVKSIKIPNTIGGSDEIEPSIAHIIKNKNGLDVLRIILGIGCFYLPYLALPVYYFNYIWPDNYPDWALEEVSTLE